MADQDRVVNYEDEIHNEANVEKKFETSNEENFSEEQFSQNHKSNLDDILKRTGYNYEKTPGQRRYGPPPNFVGEPPGHGHEVYVGKIPQDVLEEDLITLFEQYGTIYELRLMMHQQSDQNKGFCFVSFIEKDHAKKASQILNEYEIRPRKCLKVNLHTPNTRLYVANIPKSKDKDAIFSEVSAYFEGLNEVIIYNVPDDSKKKNRGFAFLDFKSHKLASDAKKKLNSNLVKLFKNDVIADWADPQEEPDDEVMSKVKALYIRNLKHDVSEDDLMKLFSTYGPLEKVKKIKDYGFVHFIERKDALQALEQQNNKCIKDSVMLVTLAKPPIDAKVKEMRKQQHNNLLNKKSQRRNSQQNRQNWSNSNSYSNNYNQDNYNYDYDYNYSYGDYYDECNNDNYFDQSEGGYGSYDYDFDYDQSNSYSYDNYGNYDNNYYADDYYDSNQNYAPPPPPPAHPSRGAPRHRGGANKNGVQNNRMRGQNNSRGGRGVMRNNINNNSYQGRPEGREPIPLGNRGPLNRGRNGGGGSQGGRGINLSGGRGGGGVSGNQSGRGGNRGMPPKGPPPFRGNGNRLANNGPPIMKRKPDEMFACEVTQPKQPKMQPPQRINPHPIPQPPPISQPLPPPPPPPVQQKSNWQPQPIAQKPLNQMTNLGEQWF